MYEPATPSRRACGQAQAPAASYGSTSVEPLGPVRGDAPPVAHAWFQPLTKKIAGDAHLVGWRFRCPFCGDEREAEHYSEAYSHAYRHLSACEWTDPLGLGPGTPF